MNKELPLQQSAKIAAAKVASECIQDGMLIGIGSGSTVSFFIQALGARCRSGLKIQAIPSSSISYHQALHEQIPMIDSGQITQLDLTIDGADEIDKHKNMTKGGGGALFREKMLALAADEMIVIVDETKLVPQIGGSPLPIEISPYAYLTTLERIRQKGYKFTLRTSTNHQLYMTDNGNYIVDLHYSLPIQDPAKEHTLLKMIPGVIETGLFFQIAGRVFVGYQDGFVKLLP